MVEASSRQVGVVEAVGNSSTVSVQAEEDLLGLGNRPSACRRQVGQRRAVV